MPSNGLLLMMVTLVTWLMGCLLGSPLQLPSRPHTAPWTAVPGGAPGEEWSVLQPRESSSCRIHWPPAQEVCALSNGCVYSITYHVSMGSRYLFCTLSYNPILFHFVAQIIPVWPRLLFHLTYVPLTIVVGVSFLGALGDSSSTAAPGSSLFISYPASRISHFSKKPFSFFVENGIRNRDPGTEFYQVFMVVVSLCVRS